MTTIQVGCDLSYNVANPTSFLFSLAAARTAQQHINQELLCIYPNLPFQSTQLGIEHIQIYRLNAEPGPLKLEYRAQIELIPDKSVAAEIIEVQYAQLPDEVLPYLNPSRYCESDRLAHFAVRLFGNLSPGFAKVMAICDWIHDNLDYQSNTTNASTSACDVLIQRVGVCRDFAHLGITLCRALCIPARYISGYALNLQPPDFHGLFEAYLGERWYLFDATRMASLEGFVRISTGRDAADASFATIIGMAELIEMSVWAETTSPMIAADQYLSPGAVSTTN